MLTIERLCAHIVRLIHAPIRVYDQDGRQIMVHIDNDEQQDPVVCNEILLHQLLEQRRLDCPSLHMDGDDIIFGIICNDKNTYILGPCCLGRDSMAAARRLVRQHGMDSKRPYQIPQTTLLDFSEILLTIFECLTGIVMDEAELHLKNFHLYG